MDRDRFRGALLGLAVGDAVGTTVEFCPPGTFEPVRDMVGGGPFALPAGAWTDDTSMALCLAESLVERRVFDPVDQLERYVRWYREGHWSSTGHCFDIGNATRAALERFERTGEPYPGDAAPDAAGNGPLMKLAPVVLAYASRPEDAVRFAGESARTTHGAPEAVDACRHFARLLLAALDGEPPPAHDSSPAPTIGASPLQPPPAHDSSPAPAIGASPRRPPPVDASLHPKVLAAATSTREPPAVRGGGYVIDALEAALWALRTTSSFEEGVLAAVNLGDDADTTAAIYGQLAGAHYGLDGIPARWRERVHQRDEILAFADALFDLDRSRPALARFAHIRPREIVSCTSPDDVRTALARGGAFAVRSGGHDFAGRSSTTGMLIDLSPMDEIVIDETMVTVGAGVQLGPLYDALAAHGRTVAAGCGPTVGISGLTLGGGIGILGRRHGLTCDQLVSAQVVLADGRIVECDAEREPDLFWALRGAGGARFGVVTRLVLKTVPARENDRFRRRAPPRPRPRSDRRLAALGAARAGGTRGQPARDRQARRTSSAPTSAAATRPPASCRASTHPRGSRSSTCARPSSGSRITARGEELPYSRSAFFAAPLPVDPPLDCQLDFMPLGGAFNRVAADATAYPHRDALFCLHLEANDQETVDRGFAAVEPYSTGGVYPNFAEPQRDSWDPAYHLGNRERLLQIKAAYDTDGVFS